MHGNTEACGLFGKEPMLAGGKRQVVRVAKALE
jgi:hypothetical protein